MPKRRTRKAKHGLLSGISYSRKIEIAGILIMAIASLILLSIISHHPNDYGIVKSLPSGSVFSLDASPARQVQNWLGLSGAWISYGFVTLTFGYLSLILPLLGLLMGWFVFRGRPLNQLGWPAAYGLWSMVLLSALAGWFYNMEIGLHSSAWSGHAGIAVAHILQNITGIGSIVILSVLCFVTLLMLYDRDLQKTVDRFRNGVAEWNARRAERRSERKARREEKRERRAERRKEHEKRSVERAPEPVKAAGQREPVTAGQAVQAGGEEAAPDGEPLVQQYEEGSDIDEIISRSHEEDLTRMEQEADDQDEDAFGPVPRAVLEKRKASSKGDTDPGTESVEDDDDVEISVFVGEGEEEAEERALDRQNRDKASDMPVIKYKFPGVDLLDRPPADGNEVDLEEIKENKRIILDKLKRHKIEILGINAIVGPTVTLYEMEPAPEVKISRIQSYANDLKMATAAHGLRIMAPIPGRSAVGIEVPNSSRETVYIRSVINTRKFVETDYELPVAFGKTIENEVFMIDLTQMPHLLMAGATGSGKSVGINTIITCLLYKCHPDNLKFVMIDPKKIELSLYRNIQNHFMAVLPGADEPIVTDTSKALETLQSVCKEMDERYELLKMAMVRDIKSYNEKYAEGGLDEELGHRHLPYIVVIIDELADLMMTAGKQIEEPIARLAQLARAIGIHLVVATQRPSVNVITGTIKANFPARIAYQVASKVDSRTILDMGGADQLVGRGDLLFTNGGGMTRLQNAFVSTEEVEQITSFIGNQRGYKQPFLLPVVQDENSDLPNPLEEIDELFEAAAKVVILHQQGSVSLLQRKLKIGYNRAGRIVDQLFTAGVVGPYQGSSARDVLVETEEELQDILDELSQL